MTFGVQTLYHRRMAYMHIAGLVADKVACNKLGGRPITGPRSTRTRRRQNFYERLARCAAPALRRWTAWIPQRGPQDAWIPHRGPQDLEKIARGGLRSPA